MLEVNQTVLMVIDVQGKLAQRMYDRAQLFAAQQRLIRGAQVLGVPILWVEQNPSRMGKTIPELAALLAGQAPISKLSFGCCGEPAFMRRLEALGRRQVLLAGIETHVCVYQTAAALAGLGYEVQAVADAVSSRTLANRQIGLTRMRAAGAGVTSVETALFELLGTAAHPAFKDLLKIVK